jgi:hypothetical protein
MGNICCGGAEHNKVGAFQGDDVDDRDRPYDSHHSLNTANSYQTTTANNNNNAPPTSVSDHMNMNNSNNNNNAGTNSNSSLSNLQGSTISAAEQAKENERLQALREEQARLELIVQATGRGMVAVRSTRGSTGYYDQGFAAALAQHLEQTTQFPATLPVSLPAAHPTDSIYARLAQPQWEGIALGTKGGGLAGCAGENPNTYMNHVAESYLDATIPKKERLFRGIGPIVENLL